MANYKVGGFTFSDEETARKAAKELKAVEYVLEQLKNADDTMVFKAYNQILDKKMFKTEVGISFLNQLRMNLLNCGSFDSKMIRPIYNLENDNADIPVASTKVDKKEKPKVEKKVKSVSTDKEINKLKRINSILLVVCITLFLCVCGMFYINSTINSPNILNYEQQLIDKYSTWEQELNDREQALRQRELVQ